MSMSESSKVDWGEELRKPSPGWWRVLEMLLYTVPSYEESLTAESRLDEARSAIRRVLARRRFVLPPEENARIAACCDMATLERWLDQSVTTGSVEEALR